MMPMIRVDDEVYATLKRRSQKVDSLNDALRRLLGLSDRHADVVSRIGSDATGVDWLKSLIEIVDRHLPVYWSGANARMYQILRVVTEFLKTSHGYSTSERQIRAAKTVANDLGVEVTTIQDKCGRMLYGTGGGQSKRFRDALEKIEKDYRSQ